ncbi:MAG: hypothetical protein V1652_00170, partial [bacterium]
DIIGIAGLHNHEPDMFTPDLYKAVTFADEYGRSKIDARIVFLLGEVVGVRREKPRGAIPVHLDPKAYIGTNIKEGTTDVSISIQHIDEGGKYFIVMWDDGQHHEVLFPIYLLERDEIVKRQDIIKRVKPKPALAELCINLGEGQAVISPEGKIEFHDTGLNISLQDLQYMVQEAEAYMKYREERVDAQTKTH